MLETFDRWQSRAFRMIKSLPETDSNLSKQINFALSSLPGIPIPASVTNAFFLLMDPSFRRFCSNVSANFTSSVAQFKTDGNFQQMISRLVITIMDLQPGSPEYENCLRSVASVLDQDVPKAQKKEELLILTLQAIALVPSYTALSAQKRDLADMALKSILTSFFNTLMPEDQAAPGAERDQVQAVAGGGAPEEAEAVEPQQPPTPEGGVLQRIQHGVMVGASQLAKVVVAVAKNVAGNSKFPIQDIVQLGSSVLPSFAQNAVAAVARQIPFLQQAAPWILTLVNLGRDVADNVHIGFGLYQHATLSHLVVFWTLEQGVMKGCFLDFTHDIHTHVRLTFTMPQATDLILAPIEPHLQRLMVQSAACEASPAVRFHLATNVHYLFHHEVSCMYSLIQYLSICYVD